MWEAFPQPLIHRQRCCSLPQSNRRAWGQMWCSRAHSPMGSPPRPARLRDRAPQEGFSADACANAICQDVNAWLPALGLVGWRADAAAGHVNFSRPSLPDQAQSLGEGLPKQATPPAAAAVGARSSEDSDMTTLLPAFDFNRQRSSEGAGPHPGSQQREGEATKGPPRGPRRHLDIRLVPVGGENAAELVRTEFALYRKYQILHHQDPPEQLSEGGFRRFLVETPLLPARFPNAASAPPGIGFGTFHQQYWIDGVLVAVGVVDILPRCLSSKYFFWDPELAVLSLGKFGSLNEIQFVAQLSRLHPSLHYFYLGFYIHSCSKMRYKAEYQPSDLLCPRSGTWVPHERVVAELPKAPVVALCNVAGALEGLGPEHNVIAGRPSKPPRHVTEGDVMSTQVCLKLWGSYVVLSVRELCLLTENKEGLRPLFSQLILWREMAREAARRLVVVLPGLPGGAPQDGEEGNASGDEAETAEGDIGSPGDRSGEAGEGGAAELGPAPSGHAQQESDQQALLPPHSGACAEAVV
eukprot:jgi/Botrbrau1/3969/Bobra.0365s0042.1